MSENGERPLYLKQFCLEMLGAVMYASSIKKGHHCKENAKPPPSKRERAAAAGHPLKEIQLDGILAIDREERMVLILCGWANIDCVWEVPNEALHYNGQHAEKLLQGLPREMSVVPCEIHFITST